MGSKRHGSAPARVVVADPHPVYRHGLVETIARRSDLELVAESADARSALEEIARHSPEVAVIELKLVAAVGPGVIEQLSAEAPATRVVLLCGRADGEAIYRGVEAGAVGVLFKSKPPRRSRRESPPPPGARRPSRPGREGWSPARSSVGDEPTGRSSASASWRSLS